MTNSKNNETKSEGRITRQSTKSTLMNDSKFLRSIGDKVKKEAKLGSQRKREKERDMLLLNEKFQREFNQILKNQDRKEMAEQLKILKSQFDADEAIIRENEGASRDKKELKLQDNIENVLLQSMQNDPNHMSLSLEQYKLMENVLKIKSVAEEKIKELEESARRFLKMSNDKVCYCKLFVVASNYLKHKE